VNETVKIAVSLLVKRAGQREPEVVQQHTVTI